MNGGRIQANISNDVYVSSLTVRPSVGLGKQKIDGPNLRLLQEDLFMVGRV